MARAIHCPDEDATLQGFGFRTGAVEPGPTTEHRCERESVASTTALSVPYTVVPEPSSVIFLFWAVLLVALLWRKRHDPSR